METGNLVLTRCGNTFPVGTVVGLYQGVISNGGVPTPAGQPVATATVSFTESLTFEEVEETQAAYYAAAKVGGAWRVIQATTRVGTPEAGEGPRGPEGPPGEVTKAEIETKADLESEGKLVESQLPDSVASVSEVAAKITAPAGPNLSEVLLYDGTKWAKSRQEIYLDVFWDNPAYTFKYEAVAAAIAVLVSLGGGTLVGSARKYEGLDGRATYPEGVNFRGKGRRATIFTCTAASAQFRFEGHAGGSGDYTLEGAETATAPFYGKLAVERTFSNMEVRKAKTAAYTLDNCQNLNFQSAEQNNAGETGWDLINGTSGTKWFRCETNTAGKYAVRSRMLEAVETSPYCNRNTFYGCIFERQPTPVTGSSILYQQSGDTRFVDCQFASTVEAMFRQENQDSVTGATTANTIGITGCRVASSEGASTACFQTDASNAAFMYINIADSEFNAFTTLYKLSDKTVLTERTPLRVQGTTTRFANNASGVKTEAELVTVAATSATVATKESITAAEEIVPVFPTAMYLVNGTTEIKKIKATRAGHRITFYKGEGATAVKFVKGENIKIAATKELTALTTFTLICDGTNWMRAGE